MNNRDLIDKLKREKALSHEEWTKLLATYSEEDRAYAAQVACGITNEIFGNRIFFRGIIEFSNVCARDCLYCGIRASNRLAERYRLTDKEILLCCKEGYRLGYRTFVLQSGEDPYYTDERMVKLIGEIHAKYPDCAITISIGERSKESYEAMFRAGADRYLLRHETADKAHYDKLHPSVMSFQNRINCLWTLKEIGYQTGCGMMVGTPFQTPETLAKDMEFICEFQPAMVGIGPFIPHKDTPFGKYSAGSQTLTLFLLSLTRIALPSVLLPSTTALGTVAEEGRINGVLAGCNVVMPNLSPQSVRKKYMLYDNKVGTETDAEMGLKLLTQQMESIGREVFAGRGDHADYRKGV